MSDAIKSLAVRLWPKGGAAALRVARGRIESLTPLRRAPGRRIPWLAPPIFDPQLNGYAGVDFQDPRSDADAVESAAEAFAEDGGGRFFLTLITDEWPRMLERLRRLRQWRARRPGLRRRIAGWHLEGPFLSPKPGFCGAHNAGAMRDPSPEDIRRLREVAGDDPLLITLAPERTGALDAIRAAAAAGIRVWLGHTDASAGELRAAFAAGAGGVTHLGNGCPVQLDRADNILWRVLDLPGARCSLIPDAFHVSPPLFRLIHRVLGADRIAYTTDAVAPAGAPPGRYFTGGREIEVAADGVVRLPGRPGAFAGSGLRPLAGAARAAMLGVGWREVWAGFATRPGDWMGIPTRPCAGAPADFALIEDDEPSETRVTIVLDGVPRRERILETGLQQPLKQETES